MRVMIDLLTRLSPRACVKLSLYISQADCRFG